MIPEDLNLGELPWITWDTASIILHFLLARCPKIRKLALHPSISAPLDRRGDAELCMMTLMRQGSFEEYIGQFVHLRELSTTTAMTTLPALLGFGQLPYLETLTIHTSKDPVGCRRNDLAEGLFPSLKNLSLYLINPKEAVQILKIKSLVQPLESLTINFVLDHLMLEDHDEDDWLCEKLFPCLRNVPNLKHLSIDVDMSNHSVEIFDLVRLAEFKRYLSPLPLQSLTIRSMALDIDFYDSHLDNTWPWLTHLRLPHQITDTDVLISISNLPNLQYLLIRLDLDAVNISLNRSNSPGRSLHTIECSEGSGIEYQPSNLNAHARCVITFYGYDSAD